MIESAFYRPEDVDDALRVEIESDGVAVATITRPERANSLNDALLLGLGDALVAVTREPRVRALVITGDGKHFCSGADLESSGFAQETVADAAEFSGRCHTTPVAIHRMSVPTIAAVNGAAVGGGFGLALSCDFRFMSEDAFMVAPFVDMGLGPDYGISYFLPRLVGMTSGLDIVLTGRRVYAREAVSLGLASEVSDDCLATALTFARSLAENSRQAMSVAKTLMYGAERATVEQQLLTDEARATAIALHSEDFRSRFQGRNGGTNSRAGA